jgi:chorismate dehydratase
VVRRDRWAIQERMLRIGCVKYLNALPLIRGWPGEVDFNHPSALCPRLANGELDVALVSSFEFLRNPLYRIVDDISISSDGPVYSVVLAHCGELSDIQEIELDPASQTSINLLRCLFAELGLNPQLGSGPKAFEARVGSPPQDGFAVANLPTPHSARLIIGDQAIAFRQRHAGEFQFWDLGEQWKKLTGLPFVYALWLIRPEVVDAKSVAQRLRALRDENVTNLDDLVSDSIAGGVERDSRSMAEFLMQYYGEHLRFSFGEAEKQGLEHFAHLCVRHGVLPSRDRTFTLV